MTAIVKFKPTHRVADSALLAACRTVSVWPDGGQLVDRSPGPLYCIMMLPPSARTASEGSKQAKLPPRLHPQSPPQLSAWQCLHLQLMLSDTVYVCVGPV